MLTLHSDGLLLPAEQGGNHKVLKKCGEFDQREREILVVVDQQIVRSLLHITVTKDEDRLWDVLQTRGSGAFPNEGEILSNLPQNVSPGSNDLSMCDSNT